MIEIIQIPYGRISERVTSTRYRWACCSRGDAEFAILQATEAGEGLFEREGQCYRVPPEHAFIAVVPENGSYRYPEDAVIPWDFSWLNLYGRPACELIRGFRESFGCVVPLPEATGLGRRFRELIAIASREPENPYLRSAQVYQFVMDWCACLRQTQRSPSDLIEAVRDHIETRYFEPGNIKSLSVRFGVSREHLTREYRARTGRTPADHLRECRARAARELIERAHLPLAEVARRTGFSDVRQLWRAHGRAKRPL
jgi:AraC-like DNA-binding protein